MMFKHRVEVELGQRRACGLMMGLLRATYRYRAEMRRRTDNSLTVFPSSGLVTASSLLEPRVADSSTWKTFRLRRGSWTLGKLAMFASERVLDQRLRAFRLSDGGLEFEKLQGPAIPFGNFAFDLAEWAVQDENTKLEEVACCWT